MTQSKKQLTTCPYCGVGCGVEVTQQADGAVSVQGDKQHPSNGGRLCSKGSALADTVGLEDRLLHPVVNGQQVSWDTALDKVAGGLQKVIAEHGPDAVAFYVSGQLLTEDYYVANKLMKGFIGSANIDTNSRLCMSSAVAGYKRAFGSDTVPGCYEDLELADLIVIEGSNTAWCHPIVFQRIVSAKQRRPEMKIIVIDPRKTATCDIADLHLPIKPGTDATLFNGLLSAIERHNKIDREFVGQHTDGAAAALQAARQTAADVITVAQICELPESVVDSFFQLFVQTEKVVTLYSQGVNQSSSGTDKSNVIINCHLLTGRIGKPGMGPFSITGQPNAMGGREVGALSNQLAAHMDLDNPRHHELVSRFWQTDRLAAQPGLKAVEMFDAIADGKIKAVWVIATNPVVTLPNADKVRKAIEDCELVIVSECEHNTGTAARADILLPALAWGEKSGTVTNSERRISRQRSFLPHPGEAEEDWWILSQVAKRMGFGAAFNYRSSADIFREHAALSGFENSGSRDFDISALADLSDEQYDNLQPLQWPVNAENPNGSQRLFTDKRFFIASGKAQLIAVTPRLPQNPVSADYPMVLNTGRVRDQWHTMTRTSRSPRLNNHIAEPIVQIHPDDAGRYQLEVGSIARLESAWGEMLARVVITDEQRPGSVFVPMHWNDFLAARGRVNALVNPVVDVISGQPESKYTPVRIMPQPFAWYGFLLSRQPEKPYTDYWVKIKGQHFYRYELAGKQSLENPLEWAQKLIGGDGDWLQFKDAALQRYRVARIENNQLVGVVFIESSPKLPDPAWLGQMFQQTELSDEQRRNLLAAKPGSGLQDFGPIVCACFGVGENTIKEALKKGEVNSIEQIGATLKAGTNCGSCIPELQKIISENKAG